MLPAGRNQLSVVCDSCIVLGREKKTSGSNPCEGVRLVLRRKKTLRMQFNPGPHRGVRRRRRRIDRVFPAWKSFEREETHADAYIYISLVPHRIKFAN